MSYNPFLTYYARNNIIPVRQDENSSARHFACRKALYHQIGLIEPLVCDRRVIEFGPGTGDNALFTDSLNPSCFFLVDGNPASIESLSQKNEQNLFHSDVQIIHKNILDFAWPEPFDVVLCEGVIPGQRNPNDFLLKVASHVDFSGSLVFTSVSPLSYLAEVCRRLLLPFVREIYPQDEALLAALVKLFAPGLISLQGMTRRHDDWVLDNILHPWTGNGLFPMDQALRLLDDHFILVGSSPSYLQDWRWFKSIPTDERSVNRVWEESYLMWRAFLIDYRMFPCPGGVIPQSDRLEEMAAEILVLHDEFLSSGEVGRLLPLENLLSMIGEQIAPAMPMTANSIEAFLKGLDDFKRGNLDADFGSFHSWFGRGQQYLHMVREV